MYIYMYMYVCIYICIYMYVYIGGLGCETNREIGFGSIVRASEAKLREHVRERRAYAAQR